MPSERARRPEKAQARHVADGPDHGSNAAKSDASLDACPRAQENVWRRRTHPPPPILARALRRAAPPLADLGEGSDLQSPDSLDWYPRPAPARSPSQFRSHRAQRRAVRPPDGRDFRLLGSRFAASEAGWRTADPAISRPALLPGQS